MGRWRVRWAGRAGGRAWASAHGVLNVAAMPPAAPQAMSVTRCDTEHRDSRPTMEPKVEPIWMIGPSRPTEPPEPMEKEEAMIFTPATDGRIRPRL